MYVLSDDQALYVAFDAKQTAEIVANQHTDDVGFDTDDEVQVDLWPGGPQGFRYLFTATPLGTHYQHSSENAAYAPKWQSVGKLRAGGFTVTMRIPFGVMRGDGRANWPIQFVRFVQKTDDLQVWAFEQGQSDHNDVVYAGTLSGLSSAAAGARPKPRIGLFGVGEVSAKHDDGTTTRSGADLSIPITRTASFVATIHPDFSNVEQDQQSISPTVYRRFFSEVRPFFAQMQNATNPFDCEVCPGITELYTPAIPTPKRGYALEGSQGPVTFNAFDSVGDRRTDNAQAFQWRNASRTLGVGYQGVETYAPGFADRLTTVGVFVSDRKHKVVYVNYGWDRGTNVLDNAQAQRHRRRRGVLRHRLLLRRRRAQDRRLLQPRRRPDLDARRRGLVVRRQPHVPVQAGRVAQERVRRGLHRALPRCGRPAGPHQQRPRVHARRQEPLPRSTSIPARPT